MVLTFLKIQFICTQSLWQSYKILQKGKYTWLTTAHLTIFVHAFCHTYVENLQKGSVTFFIFFQIRATVLLNKRNIKITLFLHYNLFLLDDQWMFNCLSCSTADQEYYFFEMIRIIIDQKDTCYASSVCKCSIKYRLVFPCYVGICPHATEILHGPWSRKFYCLLWEA